MENEERTLAEARELEEWLIRTWGEYKSGNYDQIGLLNLVAVIGERGGYILGVLRELRQLAEKRQEALNG